jgi:NADPH:quinone reductase-like Zn-dependent oxidoreductase
MGQPQGDDWNMSAPRVVQTMAKTAKAFRTSGSPEIDDLKLDDVAVQAPGPGQVAVEMHAVSLNYRDLAVVTGRYPRPVSGPTVICSDGAGEVSAVGEGVTAFQRGDRVVASFFQNWISGPFERDYGSTALGGAIDGVLTERRVFDQAGLLKVPEYMSYEEAATLPCAALTAWNALVPTGYVRAGDTVLLLGTGGVSMFGLQFAKMHGARTIVTSSSDAKLEKARALGADETVNYKSTPDWEKEVTRLTDGRGADIVLEVGGGETFTRSMMSVRASGQIVVIGVLTGVAGTVPLGMIGIQTLSVRGVYVGSVAMFNDMNRAMTMHQTRPVIDRVFKFEETRDALRYLASAQHVGKVVISVE